MTTHSSNSSKKGILKRLLLSLLIFILGVTAGALFTAHVGMKSGRFFDDTARTFMANQYAMLQYQEAQYPEAKAALQAYLPYLDSVIPSGKETKSGENPWFDEHSIAMDKTLTFGRLALLEERKGNPQASKEYWQRAQSLAVKAGWTDTSQEHVRLVVERSDANAMKYSNRDATHK